MLEVIERDGRTAVVLDQTVFYPQGGGQPFDQGQITSEQSVFLVDEVRFDDGVVYHYGHFDHGEFHSGETVSCEVDEIRRSLHSRLHSAGHVVDLALKRLDILWEPGKGYHFPQGPYVEYLGNLGDQDREDLRSTIERVCNEVIAEDAVTTLEFLNVAQAKIQGLEIAENILASEKPIRVVRYGDFGILCGGTHVSRLSEIGEMTIRKIRPEGTHIRVGYSIK